MKKFFLTFICFTLFASSFIYSQNWFPLKVGNKWQIFIHSEWGGVSSYSIKNISVYDSTVINDKIYFLLSNINLIANAPIRFDADSNKIYINFDEKDYTHMNFNPGIQSFIQYFNAGGFVYGQQVSVHSGNTSLFGHNLPYKGWTSIPPFAQRASYIADFGISEDGKIIQAILVSSDTLYDHGYKPSIISFHPPDTIFNNNIHLTLRVNHHYNRFIGPYSHGYPLNYIDTVVFQGFYTNYADTILFPSISAVPTNNSDLWTIKGKIDTSILSNGYYLFFRISAIDKGIIPHTTFSPDTGFYSLIYIDSLIVNIDNIGLNNEDFYLHQNYPNPFNPVTKIKFTIPQADSPLPGVTRGGLITLKVYDILGREITTLINEAKQPGTYEVEFNSERLPSGVYYYQLKSGSFIETKKMIILK